MARLSPLALVTLVTGLGCANLLDYDEISFETDAGVGTGGYRSAGGNTAKGGSGGSNEGGASFGGASGSAAMGGTGGSNAGGSAGTGGTSGASNGGTSGASNGGASNGGASSGGTSGASNGGASSGGTSGASNGGASSGGASGATGDHYESKTFTGATGSESGGIIPVCCVPSSTEKSRIDEGFNLLNQHRLANGVSALAYDTKLQAAIEAHTHHMTTHPFFAHDAPESSVSSPWTRANLCGTSANGENLYYGSSSAADAMNAWKGSPGHNANMLNGGFTRVGIGNYTTRWGQLFGS